MKNLNNAVYICKKNCQRSISQLVQFEKYHNHFSVRNLAHWQSDQSVRHSKNLLGKRPERMDREQPPTTTPEDTDRGQSIKKPQFGTRFLTDPKNVFEHNAWDNVIWDEQQEAEARQKTLEQLQFAASAEKQEQYDREADSYWDRFYSQHQNRFFKDRHWLFTEFPELYSSQRKDAISSSSVSSNLTIATVSGPTPSLEQPESTLEKQTEVKALSIHGEECDSADSSSAVDKLESSKNCLKSGDGLKVGDMGSRDSYPGESATFKILEVGCGVGNTVFPLLNTNNDAGLMAYCCDFSATAVQLVKLVRHPGAQLFHIYPSDYGEPNSSFKKDHRDYDTKRCHAFVWDITDESAELPFPLESLDIVVMIFVLSALHPEKMQQAVDRLASCLKPGGQILLRDYGRYDMAQLRFKKGRCLSENFYVRGDGTRVYFFTQEEFHAMFQKAGLIEVQNLIDRRLQVNRGRQLKMYRVWIQCKYQKPLKKVQAHIDTVAL